jgi:hypothetical protein
VQAYTPTESLLADHPWKLLSHFSPWRLFRLRTLQEFNTGSDVIPAFGRHDNQLTAGPDLWN